MRVKNQQIMVVASLIGRVASPQHHHLLTPNRSRLGVFICGIPTPRGVPRHSACATSRSPDRHHAPGLPLFRPIFSRNLRQLLRRGTRRRRCASTTCACADGNGWLAGLHEQSATANPRCPAHGQQFIASERKNQFRQHNFPCLATATGLIFRRAVGLAPDQDGPHPSRLAAQSRGWLKVF